jgi:hypothetical protein
VRPAGGASRHDLQRPAPLRRLVESALLSGQRGRQWILIETRPGFNHPVISRPLRERMEDRGENLRHVGLFGRVPT